MSIPRIPSLLKKYLMAISGVVLVLFVLGHMAGNLQMFVSADLMNEYAHQLQNLPYGLLWVARIGLLAAVGIHIWMAILLTLENQRARPQGYAVKATVQASKASSSMGLTGSILLIFIVFHLFHFTVRSVFPEYQNLKTTLNGEVVNDVYAMVLAGFGKEWVTSFYVFAMALLCMHLSHGVTSMFQSLGWRAGKWKPRLDLISTAYGWIIFLGFTSVPIATLISKHSNFKIFPL